MSTPLYAGIELGGTKAVCLVGTDIHHIEAELRIPTSRPEETLGELADYLGRYPELAGLGIGAFGPLNLDADSPEFGKLEVTPKPDWQQVDIYGFFKQKFACPIAIDTDVAAAGLAEYHYGAGKNLRNFVYVTLGTGIGAATILDGKPLQGLSHPEMGHLTLVRAEGDQGFESACPFHSSCLEGLASGTAISKRWGAPLNAWPGEHPAWEFQAHYLAEFCHALVLFLSPQRIIFGGGVASEALLQRVREKLLQKMNGYVNSLLTVAAVEQLVCLPELVGKAGPYGSLLLGMFSAPKV